MSIKGLINNYWDRDNLYFLIYSSNDVLGHWYSQADEDDLKYAQELLDAYRLELTMRAQELRLESALSKLKNFDQANEVINKIK